MFGSEILDIIIGLIFVYLLLSLVCSAINEYIASLLNKRGKVLFEGLERLLKDSGVADQFYKHPLVESVLGEKKLADRFMAREEYIRKHWWPAFRWLYRLVSWIRPRDRELRHFRLASYLPARTFALALVEVAGYTDPARRRAGAAALAAAQGGGNPGQDGPNAGQGGGQGGGNAVTDNANAGQAGGQGGGNPQGGPNAGQGGGQGGGNAQGGPNAGQAGGQGGGNAQGGPNAGQAGGQGGGNTQHPWTPLEREAGGLKLEFEKVLQTLMKDSAIDVTEFASLEVAGRLAASGLPDAMKTRLSTFFNDKEYELQKLHDSVEVWFNNTMDRVSGTYKRHVQAMLFAIGLVLSVAVNADTIDLWRRLSTNDKLREGLAANAASTFQLIAAARNDSTSASNAAGVLAGGLRTVPFDSASQAHAKLLYDTTLAALNRTQLQLGWSTDEAVALGVLVKRPPLVHDFDPRSWQRQGPPVQQVEWRPWFWHRKAFWPKLIGLLITAFALSLGAPFWFDMLNKVINIRNAGRAPDERSKAPEASGKRPAELPTK